MGKQKQKADQAKKKRVFFDGTPLCVAIGGLVSAIVYFAGLISQTSPVVWLILTWLIATVFALCVWWVLVAKFFRAKQLVERKIAQRDTDTS